ncbi:Dual specificity protein phosphatase 22 [Homalodisca vitripennis]|nr:Dual specificity protein phosphatase 22 [Homalodisca vitripennis]
MSRSVTVAVAYIMSVTQLNWKEALKVVRVSRAVANPNFGFQKQLQEFELYRLSEERRRLKERFPSLALVQTDEEECRLMLNSYQGLLLSKDLCEGKCALGEVCPTGLCRSPSKRILRRKSSTTTPPQSPRLLPATPTSNSRSSTSLNMMASSGPSGGRRPRSGPGGLSSYAGTSAPQSRAGSRYDLSAIPGASLPPSRAGSRQDMHTVGGGGPSHVSAPSTPQMSPHHFARRQPPLHELES